MALGRSALTLGGGLLFVAGLSVGVFGKRVTEHFEEPAQNAQPAPSPAPSTLNPEELRAALHELGFDLEAAEGRSQKTLPASADLTGAPQQEPELSELEGESAAEFLARLERAYQQSLQGSGEPAEPSQDLPAAGEPGTLTLAAAPSPTSLTTPAEPELASPEESTPPPQLIARAEPSIRRGPQFIVTGLSSPSSDASDTTQNSVHIENMHVGDVIHEQQQVTLIQQQLLPVLLLNSQVPAAGRRPATQAPGTPQRSVHQDSPFAPTDYSQHHLHPWGSGPLPFQW